jgi:uncharacterized protein YndB with AHSA1/START domain
MEAQRVKDARTIKVAPIHKSLIVKTSAEKAFTVFTGKIGRWWPRAYSIGTSPLNDVIMEKRSNGRWYERGEDGSECEWGKVLAWEPPTRVVLTWQISGEWKYEPDLITELEVRFTSTGANETRVDFEHRKLEALGDTAEAVRAQLESGWPGLLEAFAAAAEERPAHMPATSGM